MTSPPIKANARLSTGRRGKRTYSGIDCTSGSTTQDFFNERSLQLLCIVAKELAAIRQLLERREL